MIKSEKKLLDEIQGGKYRDFYLIYNRKSTDDTKNQKNSIKYQRAENLRFATREKLPIAPLTLEGFCADGIISERHSAFKENITLTFSEGNTVQYSVERPKFYRLFQWLNKGYFKGVIILCWDRASRNKPDDTIIRKLMKANADIRFSLAQYDQTSSGALHMYIDGMLAEHISRVTREKVTLTIRNSRAKGICTYRAPVGYINEGNMEHKPIDPDRSPIIKNLFDLAKTGDWSLNDLAKEAIKQGLTMMPMRRRRTLEETLAEDEDDERLEIEPISRLPSFTSIHKILTNRFYTGKILASDGGWIASNSHEGIVTDEVFNQVQEKLKKKNKSTHHLEVLDLPLRGLTRCAICHRVFTPYIKKGITYYESRCVANCPNPKKSFNFNFIAEKAGELINKLAFTPDEIEELEARANTDLALLDIKRINQLEIKERRKKKIREDLAYLNFNRLDLLKSGAYTPEKFVAEELWNLIEFRYVFGRVRCIRRYPVDDFTEYRIRIFGPKHLFKYQKS